jgi:2-polyprenyl-3-methyl-5-hydroxy-6-metoxy-1,4-benzoquinol methylase
MAKLIFWTTSDMPEISTTNGGHCQSHSEERQKNGARTSKPIMSDPIPPQVQLENTYNAAADHYDHPALSFWDRFGRRTVERLSLVPGMKVLDICCGMGGSALPAAERVGPTGSVVAVDLAQNLLSTI